MFVNEKTHRCLQPSLFGHRLLFIEDTDGGIELKRLDSTPDPILAMTSVTDVDPSLSYDVLELESTGNK